MELDISKIRRIIQKSIEDVNNINLKGPITTDPNLINTQTEQTKLLKSIQSAIRESLTNMSKIKLGTPPKGVDLIMQEQFKEQIQELTQSAAYKNLRAIEEKVAQTQISTAFEIQRAASIGASNADVKKLEDINAQIQNANEELRSRIDTLRPEKKSAAEQETDGKIAKLLTLLQEHRDVLKQVQRENSVKPASRAAAASSSTGTINVAEIIQDFNTENTKNLQQIFENDALLEELNELLASQSAAGGVIIYSGNNTVLRNLFNSSVFKDSFAGNGNIIYRRIVAEYLKLLLRQNAHFKQTGSIKTGFILGVVEYSDSIKVPDNNLLAKCYFLNTLSSNSKFMDYLFAFLKTILKVVDNDRLNPLELELSQLAAAKSIVFKNLVESSVVLDAISLKREADNNAKLLKESLNKLEPVNQDLVSNLNEFIDSGLNVDNVGKLLQKHNAWLSTDNAKSTGEEDNMFKTASGITDAITITENLCNAIMILNPDNEGHYDLSSITEDGFQSKIEGLDKITTDVIAEQLKMYCQILNNNTPLEIVVSLITPGKPLTTALSLIIANLDKQLAELIKRRKTYVERVQNDATDPNNPVISARAKLEDELNDISASLVAAIEAGQLNNQDNNQSVVESASSDQLKEIASIIQKLLSENTINDESSANEFIRNTNEAFSNLDTEIRNLLESLLGTSVIDLKGMVANASKSDNPHIFIANQIKDVLEKLAQTALSNENVQVQIQINSDTSTAAPDLKIQAFKDAAVLLNKNDHDAEIEDLVNNPEFGQSDPDGLVKLLKNNTPRVDVFFDILKNHIRDGAKIAAELLQSVIKLTNVNGSAVEELEIDQLIDDSLYNLVMKLVGNEANDIYSKFVNDQIDEDQYNAYFKTKYDSLKKRIINNYDDEYQKLDSLCSGENKFNKDLVNDLVGRIGVIYDSCVDMEPVYIVSFYGSVSNMYNCTFNPS